MSSLVSGRVAESGEKFKIVLKDLRQVYKIRSSEGAGREDFLALESFSLKVKEGEFASIVGPSGCGKSTLLDIIAGLSRAEGGQIFIDNKPVTGPALDRGIVMQGYALFPWRTVRRNVEFGLEMKGLPAKDRKEVSQKYIELVNLEGFEERYPYELSGGMKQRVAIARALAYDPEVLLMDEPFAAVDAQTRESLQDELMRIWEQTGKTILFVTHSIDEAVILADRVVVMSSNPGNIRAIIDIELARPRTNQEIRLSPAFAEIRKLVWENLQGPWASQASLKLKPGLEVSPEKEPSGQEPSGSGEVRLAELSEVERPAMAGQA
ncbi:MAG: ABC transporter ATP-binding protein [Deltaproteobacteria bacterium]|jgi:NitT/TauT family transport system ATP-binding protein|nr:ABC transporter ATP-binding protein [Deltaproteobacteria bacterium]